MSTAEAAAAPDLSGLDRLDRIRVAVEVARGARWDGDGTDAGLWWLVGAGGRGPLLVSFHPIGGLVWTHRSDSGLDDNAAGVLLDELLAAGWSPLLSQSPGQPVFACAAHADRDDPIQVRGSTRPEAISLLYLLCMGHDVEGLTE